MDYLMLVILACSASEPQCEEPTSLMRPSSHVECLEQDRVLSSGYRLMTVWQGEMREIVVSACIPMADAVGMGMVAPGAGS